MVECWSTFAFRPIWVRGCLGRLAIMVRELNQVRNGIKGEIVDEFAEGFKEIKVNYKKVDYGRSD